MQVVALANIHTLAVWTQMGGTDRIVKVVCIEDITCKTSQGDDCVRSMDKARAVHYAEA